MYKDGFDIPFETFLGFKGDKGGLISTLTSRESISPKLTNIPRLSLATAQTFRAGTIASLADKTAYGFVKKYYDGLGIVKKKK